MAAKSDINELRIYFGGLKTPQKREFIQNLQNKLAGTKSVKYNEFLQECIQSYNQEVKKIKKADPAPDTSLSDEIFARAIASMLNSKSGGEKPDLKSKLIGNWQRTHDGKIFYYNFNGDGSFETNEVPGHENLKGHYSIGIDGVVLMEPHELLQFSSFMVANSGRILTIGLTDGTFFEYTKKV